VNKFFKDTRQTGEKFSIFTRQCRKQLAKNAEKANAEFYSHLASWRVVIRTPGVTYWLILPCKTFLK
jgi:hypothetical protein